MSLDKKTLWLTLTPHIIQYSQGVAQTLGVILDTCVKGDSTPTEEQDPMKQVSGYRKSDLSGTKAGVAIVC